MALFPGAPLRAALATPPFGLPFASPPSLNSWYVGQWYGNTTGAYRNREGIYAAGQGLHFGIDFSAPCHTPVVAIGDGAVRAIDGPFGAWPHHIVLEHANGLSSLYGHLVER
ncbi:MAG: M23 family metallopeptidase, partial [Actinobacteria bacterium]|nr:M23 family metallopeptidase [Actinomycetota bacterium]